MVASATAKVTGPRSLVPLKLGDLPAIPLAVTGPAAAVQSAELAARRPEPAAPVRPAYPELPDLEKVARRCDLKIQALALLLRDPELMLVTSSEEAERLREKARAAGSEGLWMLDRAGEMDQATLRQAQEVFANLAAAMRLVSRSRAPLENGRAVPPQSQAEFDILMLMAEAQSSLRVLGERIGLEEDDDQFEAFAWLRQITERERVFIPRFMRLGDGADPANSGDLAARIAATDGRVSGQINGRKLLKEARSKIGYHVKHMLKEGTPIAADFERIEFGVRSLLDSGESEDVIRSLLAPLMTSPELWDAAPTSLRDLMADDADEREEDAPAARVYSPTVRRVREALGGARVVMTGGEERTHQRDRLASALGLDELEWVALREHASSEPLLSAIRRPGTRLVLLLVRLAGHAHVEDAQNECRALGIPCVLLKAGMNPERVAADIAAQASGVLNITSAA